MGNYQNNLFSAAHNSVSVMKPCAIPNLYPLCISSSRASLLSLCCLSLNPSDLGHLGYQSDCHRITLSIFKQFLFYLRMFPKHTLIFLKLHLFSFMCTSVLPVCMSVYHVYAWYPEIKRRPWSLWSCRWLQATMWVLGMEPVSSTRARSALSHWVNLSSPQSTHLLWYFMIILLLVSVKLSHKYRVEHRVLQSF